MGVSVESQSYTWRIDDLRQSGAAIKLLSLEPLLGPLANLNLAGIDWVIAGGESGPRARPMDEKWTLEIRNQCTAAKVPFFFKQWGGRSALSNTSSSPAAVSARARGRTLSITSRGRGALVEFGQGG
jgi:protein gp37